MAGTSKSKSQTFIAACLAGRARETDIDDFVDRWHSGTDARTLGDSLGMTKDEYALWVEDPKSLKVILYARKNGLELRQVRNRRVAV